MARHKSSKSFMDYFPYLIGIAVVIIAAVIVIGPTGETKKKIDNIKPNTEVPLSQLHKKMTGFEGDYIRWKAAAKRGEHGAEEKADSAYQGFLKAKARFKEAARENPKEKAKLEEKWAIERKRLEYASQQELPDDDAITRNRKLIEKKYKHIKVLDATCGSGVLNCPDVPIWTDSSKTQSAGKLSHNEWVKILTKEGDGASAIYHVQRRSDKREGWVESKYVKDIYDKAKLDSLKIKDGTKKKEWEDE